MRTSAANSLLAALLLAASPSLAAEEPGVAEAERLIREAAGAEKAEDCEGAWLLYREAERSLEAAPDGQRAAELDGIVANKIDKLEECYRACQPTDRQRSLMRGARGFAERGETKRATQIAKRLLVGKNEKCRFWSESRTFLRTLPKQAEEQDNDKVDPCEVSEERSAEITAAQEQTRRLLADLAMLDDGKPKDLKRLRELIELFQALDAARIRTFELREELVDCESVYAPLTKDAGELRESFGRAQELIFTSYESQVAGLSSKMRAFKKKLEESQRTVKDQQEKLDTQAAELAKLTDRLEQLSSFNEEIFDDLFELASAESISFNTQVEGRKVEQPMEEIRALIADQAKVMQALQTRYPEYFQDGVNVEGLKRKKLVLEKVEKMLGRYGERGGDGQKLGYERTMAEIDATLQMMDKAIEAGEEQAAEAPGVSGGSSKAPRIVGLALIGFALVGTVVVLRRRKRCHETPETYDE